MIDTRSINLRIMRRAHGHALLVALVRHPWGPGSLFALDLWSLLRVETASVEYPCRENKIAVERGCRIRALIH